MQVNIPSEKSNHHRLWKVGLVFTALLIVVYLHVIRVIEPDKPSSEGNELSHASLENTTGAERTEFVVPLEVNHQETFLSDLPVMTAYELETNSPVECTGESCQSVSQNGLMANTDIVIENRSDRAIEDINTAPVAVHEDIQLPLDDDGMLCSRIADGQTLICESKAPAQDLVVIPLQQQANHGRIR